MRWLALAYLIAFGVYSSVPQSVADVKPHIAMFSIFMMALSGIFAVFAMEAFDRAKVRASSKRDINPSSGSGGGAAQ